MIYITIMVQFGIAAAAARPGFARDLARRLEAGTAAFAAVEAE
jgi:hypothetical protein